MMTQEQFDAARKAGYKTLLEAWEQRLISNPTTARYVFDFEFVEGNPCLPISLGIAEVDPRYTFWPCSSWACQAGETACTHAGRRVSRQLREGYWEWPEAWERSGANAFLAANVRPHLDAKASRLPPVDAVMPWNRRRQEERRAQFIAREEVRIAGEVRQWLGKGAYELYASYGAYDFFLLSQLMGGFQRCPKNFPYLFRDTALMGLPRVGQEGAEHNALADAKTVRAAMWAKEGAR